MAKPWIGANYGQPDNALGGWRLMVLGESHHSEEHAIGAEVPDLTTGVVDWHIKTPKGRFRFYSRIERLVSRALGIAQPDPATFWNCVIFSNYIPVVAAKGPRQRPDEALWSERAAAEFRDVVNRHKVDAVLACGTTVYRRKPVDINIPDVYRVGDKKHSIHIIERDDGELAIAGHIRHPSGSFGWRYDRSLPVLEVLHAGAKRIPLPEELQKAI